MNRRTLAVVAFENLLIVGAVIAATWSRLGADAWVVFAFENGLGKAFLIAATCQLCLYYADLYDPRIVADRSKFFSGLVQSVASAAFVLAALYFWFPSLMIGRGVFLLSAVFVLSGAAAFRLFLEWLGRQTAPSERLLLVGTNRAAVALARELYDHRQALGVEIVGFVDPDPRRIGERVFNPGIIGAIPDIPTIVRERNVDRVVVSLADARGQLPMDQLLDMRLDGVAFDHLASVYEKYTGKIAVENLRPSWLIFSSGFRKTTFQVAAKRTVDVIAAVIGLVAGMPLMILVAAAVKLSSRGPALYRQERIGRNGQPFLLHKFRSMRVDAEAATGPVWAQPDDQRVTMVGRFLRRTRLDELPQFWNVLTGDMSLVGPRPERPQFVEQLSEAIAFYGQRHVVRPGLTGWAQVRYSYGASVEDALQKLQYDLYYIKNMSLALDLFIIFSTIKTVLARKGA